MSFGLPDLNESIFGLVLARKGSKGLPRKNMALLKGNPLVVSTVRIMIKSFCFQEVWVSTDCDEIKQAVEIEGAYVHSRHPMTATDTAPSLLAVQEFLEYHPEIQNVCLVQCTSPFLKEEYLLNGLKIFKNKADSVFSVTRKHLLRWSAGDPTSPLNFDICHRPSRQSSEGDLCENGMFYYCRRRFVMDGHLQGGRCSYLEVPEEDSLDIDTPFDLFLAEQILKYRTGRMC